MNLLLNMSIFGLDFMRESDLATAIERSDVDGHFVAFRRIFLHGEFKGDMTRPVEREVFSVVRGIAVRTAVNEDKIPADFGVNFRLDHLARQCGEHELFGFRRVHQRVEDTIRGNVVAVGAFHFDSSRLAHGG